MPLHQLRNPGSASAPAPAYWTGSPTPPGRAGSSGCPPRWSSGEAAAARTCV